MNKRECVILKPTNAGDGKFSFHNGSPQIEFDIPVMPKFLMGKSLRVIVLKLIELILIVELVYLLLLSY